MTFHRDHPVYCAIRRDYETAKLAPSMALNIENLARQHNSSTIPVREALIRLASEDIAELVPNRGFQVRSFGLRELEGHYRMFHLLFVQAVNTWRTLPESYHLQLLERYASGLKGCGSDNPNCPDFREQSILNLGKLIMDPTAFAVYKRSLLITRPMRWVCYADTSLEPDVMDYLPAFVEALERRDFDAAETLIDAYFEQKQERLPAIYEIYRRQFF